MPESDAPPPTDPSPDDLSPTQPEVTKWLEQAAGADPAAARDAEERLYGFAVETLSEVVAQKAGTEDPFTVIDLICQVLNKMREKCFRHGKRNEPGEPYQSREHFAAVVVKAVARLVLDDYRQANNVHELTASGAAAPDPRGVHQPWQPPDPAAGPDAGTVVENRRRLRAALVELEREKPEWAVAFKLRLLQSQEIRFTQTEMTMGAILKQARRDPETGDFDALPFRQMDEILGLEEGQAAYRFYKAIEWLEGRFPAFKAEDYWGSNDGKDTDATR